MKSKIKLAAFDMDGTLLNERKEITHNTQMALKAVMDKGIKVAFITGRSYISPYCYAKDIGLNLPIAATNGSYVKDELGNVIYDAELEKDTIKKVLDLLKDTKFYFHLYLIDGLITSEENQFSPYSSMNGSIHEGGKNILRRVILKYDELYDVKEKIYKIIVITEKDKKRIEFRKLLDKNGIFNSSSWRNNIEITSPLGTKKYGIEALLNHYNLSWDEVAAFGDNENDLPMLKLAGHPFIMGNATDEIKEMSGAKVIRDNDSEGVYHALKEVFDLNC